MHIQKKNLAPRYTRDNITSHLLVSALTCGAENLTITLVEMEPGGKQHVHAHKPEQMYYRAHLRVRGVQSIHLAQPQIPQIFTDFCPCFCVICEIRG